MAITRDGHWMRFTAAADIVTETLNIRAMHFYATTTASASTGTLITVKNGAGTVMFTVPLVTQTSFKISFGGPNGWATEGIELDAIPAGAEMVLLLA